jgi:hypothetical protein
MGICCWFAENASGVMPAKAGIQENEAHASGNSSWIPGLAPLARNDGQVVFVIPAEAGIQGVWVGYFVSEQRNEESL